jgi:hypothetical protein
MTIDSLHDNNYINGKEFWYKKAHLKTIAREIKENFGVKFGSDYNNDVLCNWVYVKFETGLLLVLYRLDYLRRVWSEIKEKFWLKICHILGTLKFFFDKLCDISTLYLTDTSLWYVRNVLVTIISMYMHSLMVQFKGFVIQYVTIRQPIQVINSIMGFSFSRNLDRKDSTCHCMVQMPVHDIIQAC